MPATMDRRRRKLLYTAVFIEVYVEVKLAYTWILSNIYLLSTSVTIQLVILGLLAFFQETQII